MEKFESRPFGFPGTRRGLTGQVKRGLQYLCGGLRPSELTCGTGAQLEVQIERGVRSRTMCRSTSQEENRAESTSLSRQNVDQLHLTIGHTLPINGRKQRADFQTDLAVGIGFVGNGNASANCI